MNRKMFALLAVVLVACAIGAGVYCTELSETHSYHITDFDYQRAYQDEQYLVSIAPRPTGTEAEAQAASYVAEQFRDAGLEDVHIETYGKLIFEVRQAELSIVPYGPMGRFPNPLGGGETVFKHTVDFVLQGFSGSYHWSTFRDDLDVRVIGNGTDDALWTQAAGKAAVVEFTDDEGIPNNTVLFFRARDAGVKALILHNLRYHKELNYPPIFKTTALPPNETEYPDIPFFMVSKDAGYRIIYSAENGSKLRIKFNVVREVRQIPVVVGEVRGTARPDEFILMGAHMDTVYDAPGAFDNTAGVSVVIETARNLAGMKLRRTVRFVTFGGEELGLYGSMAYAEAHEDEIRDNMIYMINCDMTNIELSRSSTAWIGTTSNASVSTLREIADQVVAEDPSLSRYDIKIKYAHLGINSDHAAFMLRGVPVAFGAGGGSWEYHTYMDDLTHIYPHTFTIWGKIFGTYAVYLSEKGHV